MDRVRECVLQYFDETATYTAYDTPLKGPSTDVDWPSIEAFGNCDTCLSEFDIASPAELERLRIATLALLGVTAFFAIASLIAVINWDWVRRKVF